MQTLTTNKTVFPTEQGRECESPPPPAPLDSVQSEQPSSLANGLRLLTVPPEFATIAQRIYIQLLMLFAHIYYKHFPDMVHLEAEGHLNSFAAHYLSSFSTLFLCGHPPERIGSNLLEQLLVFSMA